MTRRGWFTAIAGLFAGAVASARGKWQFTKGRRPVGVSDWISLPKNDNDETFESDLAEFTRAIKSQAGKLSGFDLSGFTLWRDPFNNQYAFPMYGSNGMPMCAIWVCFASGDRGERINYELEFEPYRPPRRVRVATRNVPGLDYPIARCQPGDAV